MNNPRAAYAHRRARVRWLMLWLDAALERQHLRVTDCANPAVLWPTVSELCHIEEELIPLLRFVSGTSEEKITKVLNSMNNGGQSHE